MTETVVDASVLATALLGAGNIPAGVLSDAVSIALAEALGADLGTRDRRLAEVPGIRYRVEIL